MNGYLRLKKILYGTGERSAQKRINSEDRDLNQIQHTQPRNGPEPRTTGRAHSQNWGKRMKEVHWAQQGWQFELTQEMKLMVSNIKQALPHPILLPSYIHICATWMPLSWAPGMKKT